jgi:hypothetical protein
MFRRACCLHLQGGRDQVPRKHGHISASLHFVTYGYQYMVVYVFSAVKTLNLATVRFLFKDDAYTLSSKFNQIV